MKALEIRRKYCPSCTEDFYNGHNHYGIQECWHLKNAKLVRGKVVGVWQNPPYDHIKIEWKPNCWRKKGVVFIKHRMRNETKRGGLSSQHLGYLFRPSLCWMRDD